MRVLGDECAGAEGDIYRASVGTRFMMEFEPLDFEWELGERLGFKSGFCVFLYILVLQWPT